MSEPLPGQKTNIAAAAFTVLQALALAGVLPQDLVDSLSQAFAGVFALTLSLKALRHAKKG